MKKHIRKYLAIICLAFTLLFIVQSGLITLAAPSPSAPAQVLGITVGLYQPPTVNYGTELNAVNTLTNKKHGIVLFYADWAHEFSFYAFLQNQINLQMAAGDRPIIMLAWGPQNGQQSLGCDQNYSGAVPWSTISSGNCDTYIRNFADAMKARSERFLIKFAHEMNGGGTPWSPINIGGPNPSGFVAAWQHVRGIFSTEGVTNVEWVWAPIYQSNPNTAANDIHLYYPGNNYVDWIGPSGYNYYTFLSGAPQPWMTFEQIYDATLKDFACRYPKPQIIHEFATVEGSTTISKTTWISDAYLKAQNYPFLRSVIWYNDQDFANPGADFRITTNTAGSGSVQSLPGGTGAWTTAYSNAVSSLVFTKTVQSLTAATPSSSICSTIYLPIIIK